MDLDEETLEALGWGSGPDEADLARYGAFLQSLRQAARIRYRSTPDGQNKYDLHEAAHTTRAQRANRARSVTLRTVNRPILKGYARIKAWRDANPEKHAANEKRYLKSEKGKAMKARKNKRHHEKRKQK